MTLRMRTVSCTSRTLARILSAIEDSRSIKFLQVVYGSVVKKTSGRITFRVEPDLVIGKAYTGPYLP